MQKIKSVNIKNFNIFKKNSFASILEFLIFRLVKTITKLIVVRRKKQKLVKIK